MKVSDALAGVSMIYFDAAPLVYYVEENPAYVKQMDTIIEQIERAEVDAFSSVILLPEVLMHPTRLGKTQLVKAYRDILFNSRQFQLVAVSVEIAERATDLRAAYNLRTPDAIHIGATNCVLPPSAAAVDAETFSTCTVRPETCVLAAVRKSVPLPVFCRPTVLVVPAMTPDRIMGKAPFSSTIPASVGPTSVMAEEIAR